MKFALRTIFWISGIVILMGLNYRRDLIHTLKIYDWVPITKKTLYRSVRGNGVMNGPKFTIKASVDKRHFLKIRVNQPVHIWSEVNPNVVFKGVVKQLDPLLVETVDSKDLLLRNNMAVKIEVQTEVLPGALGIPPEALLDRKGHKGWILVRKSPHVFEKRPIELGDPLSDKIQVLAGISEGEVFGIKKSGF